VCSAVAVGRLTEHAQTPQDGPGQNQNPQPSDPANTTDQITAVPNRPTFSTTAESVQSGVFEIEYGIELADGHQNINGLLKFGATKNLEFRFGNNPIERDAGITGGGDSGAGFKYKVVEEKSWYPTFSVLYTATIPTATAGVGAGAVGHSAGILLSKDFGKHHFDFNETAQWWDGRVPAGSIAITSPRCLLARNPRELGSDGRDCGLQPRPCGDGR
jgi:hypothetical protein